MSLTGFMGCGKSSVGRRLAELLGWRFMDLDEVIENVQGRKIPEIFATDGEAAFRGMELKALKTVIDEYSSSNLVLALGGGAVMTSECAKLVDECTYCIYLRATVDTLVKNLEGEASGRPMLQSPAGMPSGNDTDESFALRARITDLMSLRASTYESIASRILDTDGKSIDKIATFLTSVGKKLQSCRQPL